jgi:hypothetical protein
MKPIKGSMVGLGGGKTVEDIRYPFTISRGWFSTMRLSMEEAENLRDWITEQLNRPDARYPFYK